MRRRTWSWRAGAAVLCVLAVVCVGCSLTEGTVSVTPTPTATVTATPTLTGTVLPGNVHLQPNIVYGTDGTESLKLDAYVPPITGKFRSALICVHGGGWVAGGKADWAHYAMGFASQGWVVFSIDYRLDSPTPFPSELNDLQTAIRWVRDHSAAYGLNPARIGLVGSSAGANLAALAATQGSGSLTSGARVSAVVSWSGPLDLSTIQQQGLAAQTGNCTPVYCDPKTDLAVNLITQYLGCTLAACPDRYAQASATTFVDPTDPPMLLANSGDEIIPAAQANEMAQKLQAAGVPNQVVIVPGTSHGIADGTFAFPATIQFLLKYLPPQ